MSHNDRWVGVPSVDGSPGPFYCQSSPKDSVTARIKEIQLMEATLKQLQKLFSEVPPIRLWMNLSSNEMRGTGLPQGQTQG